jgi:hypothetical protein
MRSPWMARVRVVAVALTVNSRGNSLGCNLRRSMLLNSLKLHRDWVYRGRQALCHEDEVDSVAVTDIPQAQFSDSASTQVGAEAYCWVLPLSPAKSQIPLRAST